MITVRELGWLLRNRRVGTLARAASRALRRLAWSTDVMIIYQIDRETWTPEPCGRDDTGPLIRRDALEDFRSYARSIWHLSRERMMAEAARRLTAGEHCHTIVEDGVLLHYGWIQLDQAEMHLSEMDFTYRLPPRTAVVYNVYTEPGARGRGLYRRSFAHRVAWLFEHGAEHCVWATLTSNRPARHVSEAVFRTPAVARIIRTRRLGRSRAWVEPILVPPPR